MNLKTTISGAILLAAVAAAPGFAEVQYQGDADAVAVCKAIVSNDKNALRKTVTRLAPRYVKMRAVKHAERIFQCNGMSLAEFAAEVGAQEALAVLGRNVDGRVAAR